MVEKISGKNEGRGFNPICTGMADSAIRLFFDIFILVEQNYQLPKNGTVTILPEKPNVQQNNVVTVKNVLPKTCCLL